jgi:hypothetical protein
MVPERPRNYSNGSSREAARNGDDAGRYSVGFPVTEPVRQAICEVPARVWAPALTPDERIRRGARVTEITNLVTLTDGWPRGMRILARTEPPHPRHRKQASAVEREREQRFQVIARTFPETTIPNSTPSTATTRASNP